MTQLLDVDEQRRDQILTEAADRQAQILLSHRIDQGWATYKSHILQADSGGTFLVLAQPVCDPGEVPPELVPGERIGLSFRRGHKKCMCALRITRLMTFATAEGTGFPAIQVPWPTHIQELQRRLYYRAAVPSGRRIEVSMWDGGILERDPKEWEPRPFHVGLLQDLSAGGCRVVVDQSRDPLLQAGDTIGIRFQPDPRSRPILVDAVFRHAERMPQRKLSLGFQLVGLEACDSGRAMLQALSRVVSTFLRIEMRRKKNRLQRPQRRRQ